EFPTGIKFCHERFAMRHTRQRRALKLHRRIQRTARINVSGGVESNLVSAKPTGIRVDPHQLVAIGIELKDEEVRRAIHLATHINIAARINHDPMIVTLIATASGASPKTFTTTTVLCDKNFARSQVDLVCSECS